MKHEINSMWIIWVVVFHTDIIMSVKGNEDIDADDVQADHEIKNGINGVNSRTWINQLFQMNELEPMRVV
jgi:hypothetical protein